MPYYVTWRIEQILIDAHAHLDRYEEDLEAVLEEINQNRIFTISTSMDVPAYERNLKIAGKCDLVLPTFGIHPWNATEYVAHLGELRDFIDRTPMIGEIGLDHYFVKEDSRYPAQTRVFEFFLAAAREQGKTVNVHAKGAEKEVLDLLRRYDIERAIIHWYSGPLDVLREMIDRGFYFTVGVEVLYSEHIQTIAQSLPSERLLTETDNPAGRKWLAGAQATPILIKDVVQKLAELRKTKAEAIMETVQDNFIRLIRDDTRLLESCGRIFGLTKS